MSDIEKIAAYVRQLAGEYDAAAIDSSDWYVKAAGLLRALASDIRDGAWRETPAGSTESPDRGRAGDPRSP